MGDGDPFYHLDSSGEGTNLQLFSIRQAWRYWNRLQGKTDYLDASQIRERCVFIVAALGMSVSQLLGQNVEVLKPRLDVPEYLLTNFLRRTDLSDTQRDDLIRRFADFLPFYNDSRHFGKNVGGTKHRRISQLDAKRTGEFVDLTLEIWDTVLLHFKKQRDADLDDYTRIRDLLEFGDDY